ncbi:MAG: alpha/beta fold hydrolase, partial [Pseudomonadota bacterium]
LNPFTPRAFAFGFQINGARARRLIRETGSNVDARGLDLYERLAKSPAHVAGALGMMANWDLAPLVADLARLEAPVDFITGASDRTVPPEVSRALADRLPGATLVELDGLGHLAHEEAPDEIAALIEEIAGRRAAAAL